MVELEEFINDVDPNLLINMDESGLDHIVNNSKKKVIVSSMDVKKN